MATYRLFGILWFFDWHRWPNSVMIHVVTKMFRIDLVTIFRTKWIDLFSFLFFNISEELKAHWEKLERERRQNEALSSKLADMEAMALRRETDISDLKRLLQLVKDEHVQILQVNKMKNKTKGKNRQLCSTRFILLFSTWPMFQISMAGPIENERTSRIQVDVPSMN